MPYISNLPEALKRIDLLVADRAKLLGQQYENNWVRFIRASTPTGKFYRVPGGKRKRYQASAPGQPPAIRTGQLLRSMKRTVIRERTARYRIRITWGVLYMRFLEFGTSRMAARPSARPALRMLSDQLRGLIQNSNIR